MTTGNKERRSSARPGLSALMIIREARRVSYVLARSLCVRDIPFFASKCRRKRISGVFSSREVWIGIPKRYAQEQLGEVERGQNTPRRWKRGSYSPNGSRDGDIMSYPSPKEDRAHKVLCDRHVGSRLLRSRRFV